MATPNPASAREAGRPLPTWLAGGGPGTAPQLPASQLAAILTGMIGQGHGIEAVCFFLRLTREALLDLAVLHDLPTPHDRPRRTCGGARAWTGPDYAAFIACWIAGWRAGSIGECLGRSPGSIWSKARRLGLPRRDRKFLVKPSENDLRGHSRLASQPSAPPDPADSGQPAGAVSESALRSSIGSPAHIRACGTAAHEAAIPPRPRAWLVCNAIQPVWVRFKANRDEIEWDRALDDEVANRCWAYQHPATAARDFGITLRTYTSRYTRLELPQRERSRLVEHYDPAAIAANIAAHGFVKRQCLTLRGWWFWGPRSRGASYSKRSTRSKECVAARKYASADASVALPSGNFDFAY